jgi:hypothetical protein
MIDRLKQCENPQQYLLGTGGASFRFQFSDEHLHFTKCMHATSAQINLCVRKYESVTTGEKL